jgi:iron complex transport system substrate-binding protein
MTLRPRALLLAAAAALVLTACGSADDDAAGSGEAWSYTSGDGKTYTADEVPTRIIAQGEAAAALIAHGIKPVGIFLSQPLEDTKSLQGVDLDGIEIIGETWGKIDAEKAAALRPDLIASGYWTTEKAYGGLEDGVEESSKKVGTLAPVVGPVADQSVEEMLDGFEELSATLGADLDALEIASDKKDFEDARDRFQETVAQADGLTAMAVSPAADVLYVAVPKHSAELADFSRYGLDIIVPKDPDPDFSYWENLSWENADRYQPDLVLMDDRTLEQSTETAEKQPTWRKIEAVEAGAVTPWPAYWISTYRDYAEQLDRLGDAVEKADPDLT